MRTVTPIVTRRRSTPIARLALLAAFALGLFGASPALASTISVSGTELTIEGENDSDVISVSTDGTTLTIVDTGAGNATDGDVDCSQLNPTTVTCPARLPGEGPIDHFEVRLNNGVDSFVNQNLVTSNGHVHSDDGFNGPASGAKTIVGGPGGQSLWGGQEGDSIDGGEGSDSLFDGGGGQLVPTGGNDLLVGGPGDDTTEYSRSSPPTAVNISLDNVANDGQAGEADNVQVENVVAGLGNDVLTGDAGSNLLSGGPGGDVISGLGGNDELFGDAGGPALAARGLAGFGGDDTLDGGAGRDGYDCGRGFDLALHDLLDELEHNCERTGAEVVGDSATLKGKKKNKFKVEILCPESEVAACSGKLVVTAAGKKLGKGKFGVAAGKTKKSKAKLTKKGVKALRKAGGSLLVSVVATTEEPGGVSENSETILIHD